MSSEADASAEMRKVIVRLMDIIDYVYVMFFLGFHGIHMPSTLKSCVDNM